VGRGLATRSPPERDGDGDQEKNGDHEARHAEQAGDRCALATRKHRGPGQGELTGEQFASRPADQPDQRAEHPGAQLVEEPGHARPGDDHADADDQSTRHVGDRPEGQALVEPAGAGEEEQQCEPHRGHGHAEGPPAGQEEPAVK